MAWCDVARRIRTDLLDDATVSGAVGEQIHYQTIPQESQLPRIWFTRDSRNEEDAVDGNGGLVTETYALEIIANDNAEDLVDAVADVLNAISGEPVDESEQYISLVEVTDADDDYLFKSAGDGEPAYMHALSITVYLT